jgi:hypothetical protein
MPLGNSSGPVRIPESQLRPDDATGAPLTVGAAGLGFMVPLQWFDEAGNPHNDVFFILNGVVYKPRESEQWASSMGKVKTVLADEVMRRFKAAFKAMIREIVNEVNPQRPRMRADVDLLDEAAVEVADEVGSSAG